MELNAFLKARVPTPTKVDFEAICQEMGVAPTTKLREMIDAFVKAEYHRLSDRVTVNITRPDDYQFGAWRVLMKLRDPKALTWNGTSIPFALPHLPHRLLNPDDGYLAVVTKAGTVDQPEIGGVFANGMWRANLYSNGIHEAENPTSIEAVQAALVETVTMLVDRFKA